MGGRPFNDLTGQHFGRWTVLKEGEKRYKKTTWSCRCVCGGEKDVPAEKLIRGKSKSCGCLNKEMIRERSLTHGSSYHPLISTWHGIITRCTNKEFKQYPDYGGRGIKVCERWLDINNFISDMGEKPSRRHTLDRIDVNGDYEPSNCRWATWSEQNRNQRVKKNSTTGVTGVSYIGRINKYMAYINVDGEQKRLGYFVTLEEAKEAREEAEMTYWRGDI